MTRHSKKDIRKTVKRLRALAKFIDKRVPEERVNMEVYVSGRTEDGEIIDKDDICPPEDAETLKGECGTAFCAVGWEAVRKPKSSKGHFCWAEYSFERFPALCDNDLDNDLYDTPHKLWSDLGHYCFFPFQTLSKEQVVERLKYAASTLESQLTEQEQ